MGTRIPNSLLGSVLGNRLSGLEPRVYDLSGLTLLAEHSIHQRSAGFDSPLQASETKLYQSSH